MLPPKTKRNISRIIPFGLIWLGSATVYSLMERGILGQQLYYPSTGNPYNFEGNLLITSASALVMGLVMGTIEILYLQKLFSRRSFSQKIIFKTGAYVTFMILFLILTSVLSNARELQVGYFDRQVWQNTWAFFTNFAFWSLQFYLAATIGVSLFYAQVSENLGQGVLSNFFTGKYHNPMEEERIFMFLDMKSSTSIAERLGHVRYFEMLRTYYADLSGPVIEYSGEIYQYVGDEMIISWRLKNGLENLNCLRCFYAMKEALLAREESYLKDFGVLPEFKAALHCGKVTTGEIGVIKTDIIFTGDVLNTTARLQGLCNSFHVDLLISDNLLSQLQLGSEFRIKSLGVSELRGRDEKVGLSTVLEVG
ncbi:MAG: adenylate/guanylate cyclase domain-containing protein [Cyclobacteriaceae bacterium]